MKLKLLLLSLAFVFTGAHIPLPAQIQGNQGNFTLPGGKDYFSRVSGFTYGGQYYIAYGNATSSGVNPALFYGGASLSSSTPPVLTLANAQSVNIPGLPNNNTSWHMATGIVQNAPYIFQFNYAPNNDFLSPATLLSITYEKMIPPVIAGNAPTFSAIKTAPSSLVSNFFPIHDVAGASLGSSMYLFLDQVVQGQSSIALLNYAGEGTGGVQLLGTNIFAGQASPQPITSLDATSVTLASGEQAIVLVACLNDNGNNVQVLAWLFSGNVGSPVYPLTLAQPQNTLFNPSVRLAYGPATGTAKTNSCTLFLGSEIGGFGPGGNQVQTTQINLPASLSGGGLSQASPWRNLSARWLNNFAGGPFLFPYDWTVFSVPMPTSTSSNGYANVDQYLALVEFQDGITSSTGYDSFVTSMTQQLIVNPTTAGQTWVSGDLTTYTGANTKPAVQSWNLLGIITGTPPLPAGTKVNYRNPLLTLAYDNSTTTGAQQISKNTTAVSASIGGPKSDFNASYSYSNATTQGSEASNTFTLGLTLSFNSNTDSTYDAYSNIGYMIVSEPNYVTANYNVFAYDGTTPLGISTVSIYAEGTNIEAIPFYLNQPNLPYPGYPALIYQSFPANSSGQPLVSWPQTTDIQGWMGNGFTLPTLTNVQSLFKAAGPQYIFGSDSNSTILSLSSSSLNSYSRATKNRVSVGTGINFLGIKVGTTGTVSLSSQQSTTFSSTESSQISYPQLQDSQGYSQVQLQAIFNKVAEQPDIDSNWIPTIFRGSKPWILTWQVISAQPTSSAKPAVQASSK